MTEMTTGTTKAAHNNGFEGLNSYDAIRAERAYQDRKWGGPDHDRQHSFADWALILGREYGEVLAAIGAVIWPSSQEQRSSWDRHMALRAELVQVAAVAVALIEQMSPQVVAERAAKAPTDEALYDIWSKAFHEAAGTSPGGVSVDRDPNVMAGIAAVRAALQPGSAVRHD